MILMKTIINVPRVLSRIALSLLCLGWTGCALIEKPKDDGSTARQIYDMEADGNLILESAIAAAARSDKHVLLSLGANWCSDSQKTYDVLHTHDALKRIMADHYILAMVDANNRVGFQRNADIVDRYGVDLKRGIPALLILDSNGELMTTDPDQRPKDSDHEAPQNLIAYLDRT